MSSTEKPVVEAKKKRVRKNVGKAIAFVKASFNNTIITVTDGQGHVIAWDSAAMPACETSSSWSSYLWIPRSTAACTC